MQELPTKLVEGMNLALRIDLERGLGEEVGHVADLIANDVAGHGLVDGRVIAGECLAMRARQILAEGDGARTVVDARLQVEIARGVDQHQLHLLRSRERDQLAHARDRNGVVDLERMIKEKDIEEKKTKTLVLVESGR